MYRLLLGLLVFTLACREPAGDAPVDSELWDVAAGDVELVEVSMPWLDTLHLDVVHAPVALTDDEYLIAAGAFDPQQRLLMSVHLPSGETTRFGRTGRGPGEVRFINGLFGGHGEFTIYDNGELRFLRLTSSGRHRWTTPPQPIVNVHTVRGDSVDGYWEIDGTGASPVLRRQHLRGDGGRDLLHGADSIWRAWRGEGRLPRAVDFATFADGRVVLLNPFTYEVQYYDNQGTPSARTSRDLPSRFPTEREVGLFTEQLMRQRGRPFYGPDGQPVDIGGGPSELELTNRFRERQLPHLYGGSWIDDAGRLWVIGQANDSTWVDLFNGTEFVKRWNLPCAGDRNRVRNAKTETHLALVCAVDDSTGEIAARIRLYRIVSTSN